MSKIINSFILVTSGTSVELADGAPDGTKRYWKQIAKYGEFVDPRGGDKKMVIDKQLADKLVSNFKSGARGLIPVPLGHPQSDAELADKNRGALIDAEARDDGLYGLIEIRDPDTAEKIDRGMITDDSIAFDDDYQDKKTGKWIGPTLKHVGLVVNPFLKGMKPFQPVTMSDGAANASMLFSEGTQEVELADETLPLADEGTVWDANAAIARVKQWATSSDGQIDYSKYGKAFFSGSGDLQGNYKLPFADVIDGELKAVWRGVAAAYAAVQGARGGVEGIDKKAVLPAIEAYYKKFNKQLAEGVPTMQDVTNDQKFDVEVKFTDADGNEQTQTVKAGETVSVPEDQVDAVKQQIADAKAPEGNADGNNLSDDEKKAKELAEKEEALNKREAELAEKTAESQYERLLSEGKIVPAQKEAFLALASRGTASVELSDGTEKTVTTLLSELFEKAPKGRRLSEEGGEGDGNGGEGDGNDVELSDEEKSLGDDFGNTPEELAAYKKEHPEK